MNNVFTNGRKAFEVGVTPTDVPTMPIEFSVAAYRLGHSMIRRAYNWNRIFDDGFGSLDLLFEFSGPQRQPRRQPRAAELVDRRLPPPVRLRRGRPADLAVPAGSSTRMRIDTRWPIRSSSCPGFTDDEANLAFRNLTRAKMVRLATGQQMVAFLRSKGVSSDDADQGADPRRSGGADLDGLTPGTARRLLTNTPLWFYILREAELNAGKLTGVGARIVAETFHRAMEGSEDSIVRDHAFRPSLGPNNTTFRWSISSSSPSRKKTLLAPLG